MNGDELDSTELALVRELEKHANEWVAILNYGGDNETVVSSGETIRQAREKAEALGFKDLTFLKVPPTDRIFVPANFVADTNAT